MYNTLTPTQLDRKASKTMDEMVFYENSMARRGISTVDIIQSDKWKELKNKMTALREAMTDDMKRKHGNPIIEEVLQYITT